MVQLEVMALFIDKYDPTCLEDLKFNKEHNKLLASMSSYDDTPHMIIHGPPGSGKKTRAKLFLFEKYGKFKMTNSTINVKTTKCKTTTEPVKIIHSPYHFQLDPSANGVYDRVIIRHAIQDVVKFKIVNTDKKAWNQVKYRIIIIENADKLTLEAQQSMRRTLEVYVSTCRLIFIVTDITKVIPAIQSRCMTVHIAAPTSKQIYNHLKMICYEENITYTSKGLTALTMFSNRNIKKAMMFLQLIAAKCPSELMQDSPDFKNIDNTRESIFNIIKAQVNCNNLSKAVDQLRTNIYDLHVNCVDPKEIIIQILDVYLKHLKKLQSKNPKTDITQFIAMIIKSANDHNYTVQSASQPVYHIEAFCLKLLHVSKLLQRRLSDLCVK